MTIGELARCVGIRPSAIRYYEARGILVPPQRSASEYRLYGSEALSTIRFVQRARELGFSLQQVQQLIRASRTEPPCIACRELIERQLAQVEEELRRLRGLRDRLKRLKAKPVPIASNVICPLIEEDDGHEPLKVSVTHRA
jgi:DNA-binding transcriptional MerR regulator